MAEKKVWMNNRKLKINIIKKKIKRGRRRGRGVKIFSEDTALNPLPIFFFFSIKLTDYIPVYFGEKIFFFFPKI